jgi:uncharacterized protein (DUF362 family)
MSEVAIVRVEDEQVDDAVRQAIDLAGGFASSIRVGSTVLIKPNVVGPYPSGSGKVTDARVTEAVTRLVQERRPKRVIIGEGSAVGYDRPGRVDSMHCLEVNGAADVARRLDAELVDLNRDQRVEVRVEDAFVMDRFHVAKTAWEADAIVCLPVMKTHIRTGITCGLKNMKGVLPGDEKRRTHRLGLDRGIVDLNRVVKPDFTVVDAIVAMEGTNRYPEDQVPIGGIIAGADVVAVDAVCAGIMGFDVEQILHVQLAAEEGLGIAELEKIEVRGASLAESSTRFASYQEAAMERFGTATIIEKNTCTGCIGELDSLFLYLSSAGFEDRFADMTLVLGIPDEVPPVRGTPVVIGKCAREYRGLGIFVPGCPPHGIEITDAACEALNIDKEVIHRAITDLHKD